MIDISAEFTLRLARLAQDYKSQKPSMAGWFVVPSFQQTAWDDMRDALTAAPKPVIVAPLIEPGYLSLWSISQLAPELRQAAERVLSNQLEFWTHELNAHGLGSADTLQLSVPDADFRMTVADFLGWARDYATPLGVAIDRGTDPRVGHLIMRVPGGGAQPIGWVPPIA